MTSYPQVGSEDHCGQWAAVTSTYTDSNRGHKGYDLKRKSVA
jgi:hypothetical protein